LKQFKPETDSVLEVGSKDYGNTQDFRSLFDCEYVGLDMEDGKGVDVVHDLTTGTGELGQYGLIICCSILEHVKNPWLAAETLTKLLKPGGSIYISTPWVQRYHKYPDDYWRFTFPALQLLFEGLELGNQHLSTFTAGEFLDLALDPDCDSAFQMTHGNRTYLPCYELHTMGTMNETPETTHGN